MRWIYSVNRLRAFGVAWLWLVNLVLMGGHHAAYTEELHMCVCYVTTQMVLCDAGNMGFGASPSFGQQQTPSHQVFMQLSPCFCDVTQSAFNLPWVNSKIDFAFHNCPVLTHPVAFASVCTCHSLPPYPWAARYNTWLLIKSMTKGYAFSCLSCHHTALP